MPDVPPPPSVSRTETVQRDKDSKAVSELSDRALDTCHEAEMAIDALDINEDRSSPGGVVSSVPPPSMRRMETAQQDMQPKEASGVSGQAEAYSDFSGGLRAPQSDAGRDLDARQDLAETSEALDLKHEWLSPGGVASSVPPPPPVGRMEMAQQDKESKVVSEPSDRVEMFSDFSSASS